MVTRVPHRRQATLAPESLAARLPPSSFFLVSAVFHYLGPSLAVLLFLRVPVLGMAWLRIVSAAVVFGLWRRPWRLVARLDRAGRCVLVQLGVVLAAMNTMFYLALARLPLSTVGAIEFLGTVLLAAAAARSRRNVLALALTTAGVATITDVRLTGQPLGFACAFGNGVLFMRYVVLGHRIASGGTARDAPTARSAPTARDAPTAQVTPMAAIDQLGASMLIAAAVITPVGLGGAFRAFGHPVLLLAAAGVGVCSSVIPYVTDQLAMARLPRATFALMLALLPMFAVVIGAIVLGQIPGRQDLAGIALVITGVAVHQVPRAGTDPDPETNPPLSDKESAHAVHAAGLVGTAGVPDLPGHDELRQHRGTRVASARGRRRADRGPGGGRRRHVLRHRRHVLGRADRGDHRAAARQAVPQP
jgi:inner membrane transporter RhtA